MAIWNTIQLSEIHPDRCDAEYFRKDYQDNLNLLENTGDTITLGKLFKYINRGTQPLYNKKGTLKALRSVNVGFMNFNETRQEYVTEGFFAINTRGKVQKDDVLITSTGVGTLGRTSIWFKNERVFCDGHITILRNGKVDPYFVTAFLNSKFGLKQYDQNYRGSSGQIEIYPYDISKFVIPECLLPHQTEIGNYLREAFELQTQSQTLYKQATDLLEKELGLDKISFERPSKFISNYSEVVIGGRISSYFFQPKYSQLDNLLANFETTPLRKLVNYYSTGFAFPKKHILKEKTDAPLIKIANIKLMDIDISSSDFINSAGKIAGTNETIKIGDILIGMSGSVGTSAVIREEKLAYINQRILRINSLGIIDPEYLALVINSLVGKMQFEKYGTGGVQVNISPRDMLNIKIPRLGLVEDEISGLIKRTFEAIKQYQQLLANAKARVEQLIEEAANK